ncbi:MAG: diacylglycerol kinase family protein, partial [Oscillospiraceae bacterium]
VYVFSLFYGFGKTEYALLTVLVAGVTALELVNSAFERTVSKPSPERYVTAGVVKDMGAGAVLLFSIGAAVCGFLLFWDVAVFKTIAAFFGRYPVLLAVLLASFAASYWFIFCFNRKASSTKGKKY